MNNEIIKNDEVIICNECEFAIDGENDLFVYNDMNVCERCYDKFSLIDEQEVQDWETEGYDYE